MDREEAQLQTEVDEAGYRVDGEVDPEVEAMLDAEEEFPEVNPRVYREVEEILFQGFLTISAEIGGVPMVFKSLNHREMEMVGWMSGGEGSSKRYYDTFIAFSLFMVGGENLLPDRDRRVPSLVEVLKDIPDMVRSAIVRQLSELNRRASDALALTEAYAMEKASRWRWAQQKGTSYYALAGIPGVEALGYNYAQLVWRALNYYEDMKDEAERHWDNAKFIGSCFAGKEIKKIYNQDKQRKKQEKRDRYVRKDQILQKVILGKDIEGQSGPIAGRIQIASTVKELTEQVRKSLAGEKDWHDEIVDRANEQAKRNMEREEKQRQEMFVKARQVAETPEIMPSRGFSLAEVNQRTERFRQTAAQTAASRILPLDEEGERRVSIAEKYLIDDAKRDEPIAHVGSRPKGTPFGR